MHQMSIDVTHTPITIHIPQASAGAKVTNSTFDIFCLPLTLTPVNNFPSFTCTHANA